MCWGGGYREGVGGGVLGHIVEGGGYCWGTERGNLKGGGWELLGKGYVGLRWYLLVKESVGDRWLDIVGGRSGDRRLEHVGG